MELIIQLIIGGVMIGITVLIHALGLDFIIRHVGNFEPLFRRFSKSLWKALISSVVVLLVFVIHIVIMHLWALLFMFRDCAPLESFADALYFSTVVYTTLGFGDFILEPPCRMLSGIEGANGFILFGWTAAFIFEIVTRIYRREARSL